MAATGCIWIVDDDHAIRWVLARALRATTLRPVLFETGEAALRAAEQGLPDAVITDVRMPGIDGWRLMAQLQRLDAQLPVIVMTAHADLDSAVSAFQGGAFDYLAKPFDVDDAVLLAQRAVQHYREAAQAPAEAAASLPDIIGEAPAMQDVFRTIGRLSRSSVTVLINGESGTGKELVARALHRYSPRSAAPFIALNMAAIPKALMESELFGHEKGAFTGAQGRHRGRSEQADGGTLFLDEIGDMPADLQTRLLRVLADGEFYRVGGHQSVKVDVRIIAATHQELEHGVRHGAFREDLFHRLNVIRVHLPALRQRREDIPALARCFLARAAREWSLQTKALSPEVEACLQACDWPGNVRALENVCRWLTVMTTGRELQLGDLPEALRSTQQPAGDDADWASGLHRWAFAKLAAGDRRIAHTAVARVERTLIAAALEQTAGQRQAAAALLGWGRNTLTRKMKALGRG